MLVRPNGYTPLRAADDAHDTLARADTTHLRLVHFGLITSHRVDLSPFLEALISRGRWQRITFTQYGDDYSDMLDRA